MLLTIAVVLFVLAAVGGAIMAGRILRSESPPRAIVLGHGLAAGTALLLLVIAVAQGPTGTAVYAGLVLLVLAALGGFFLLSYQARGTFPPRAAVLGHGALAVIGVLCLVAALLVGS